VFQVTFKISALYSNKKCFYVPSNPALVFIPLVYMLTAANKCNSLNFENINHITN